MAKSRKQRRQRGGDDGDNAMAKAGDNAFACGSAVVTAGVIFVIIYLTTNLTDNIT